MLRNARTACFTNFRQVLGSTNTLGALQQAFSDTQVGGCYFISDGLPDQDQREIIDFIATLRKSRPIIVNAISFSCIDPAANAFLATLAEESGGSFQYFMREEDEDFYFDVRNRDMVGPMPMEHGDCLLVREELNKATEYLDRMNSLYRECTANDIERISSVRDGREPHYTHKATSPAPALPIRRKRSQHTPWSETMMNNRPVRTGADGRPVWDSSGPGTAQRFPSAKSSSALMEALVTRTIRGRYKNSSADTGDGLIERPMIDAGAWLKINGLKAAGLDFTDWLVRHALVRQPRGKYVAILDKTVETKVSPMVTVMMSIDGIQGLRRGISLC